MTSSMSPIPACGHNRYDSCVAIQSIVNFFRRAIMGKYVLAWVLGIPAVVLVAVYLIAH
jgi:hypothetical protein